MAAGVRRTGFDEVVELPLADGGRTYEVPFEDVQSARLVFEFGGPQSKPKPGGPKKKRK